MGHWAQIDDGSIVTKVLVADDNMQGWLESNLGGAWIQTSYNTKANQHSLGGTPLRYNFAGIGYTYDADRDAFIPPKLSETAVLDEATCLWIEPDDAVA